MGSFSPRRDVTERQRLEDELRQAQKMESIGRLAGGVAHDFNNMLTATLGFSEILIDESDPSGRNREDLQAIHKAAEHGASLTRQLLAFSRRQILEPTILDLGLLARDLEGILRRLLGEDIDTPGRSTCTARSVTARPLRSTFRWSATKRSSSIRCRRHPRRTRRATARFCWSRTSSLRELLSRTLSRCGYSVVAPPSPEEALRLAQSEIASLQLLVTDAIMPGMSGPVLARHVTQCWPDVRVLFISGYTDDAMLRLGLLESNQTLLQKPFGPRAFLRKVREVLDGSGGSTAADESGRGATVRRPG